MTYAQVYVIFIGLRLGLLESHAKGIGVRRSKVTRRCFTEDDFAEKDEVRYPSSPAMKNESYLAGSFFGFVSVAAIIFRSLERHF